MGTCYGVYVGMIFIMTALSTYSIPQLHLFESDLKIKLVLSCAMVKAALITFPTLLSAAKCPNKVCKKNYSKQGDLNETWWRT